MPFRGKPSKGCEECRRARKKCDLREGGCTRCGNAGRICSGYPDQSGLRIVDQSHETAAKSAASQRKRSSGALTTTTTRSSSSVALPSPSSASPDSSPPPFEVINHIMTRVDNEAHPLAFFFGQYVVNNTRYHSFLDSSSNSHLISSIKAFGYAGISQVLSDPRLLRASRRQYIEALQLTNAALRDPELVTRDETLLSILVLTNYETLTGGIDKTLEAWEKHVHGATALLDLRGQEGIQGDDGRLLTMHVIANIMVVCLMKDIPNPPGMFDIHQSLHSHLRNPREPNWLFVSVNQQIVDFRSAVTKGKIRSIWEIVARGYELDSQSLAAFMDATSYWDVEVVGPKGSSDDGLPTFQVRYWDQATAHTYTSGQALRILLHEVVNRAIQTAEQKGMDVEQLRPYQLQSISIIKEMQAELMATMPQILGLDASVPELYSHLDPDKLASPKSVMRRLGNSKSTIWSHFKDPTRNVVLEVMHGKLPVMRAMGGYGILWPLFTVGNSKISSPTAKKYVKRVYSYLGDHYKIEQALVLRDMLP